MGKRARGPRNPVKEAARRARQAEIHAARDAARAADLAANPRPSRAVRLDLGLPPEANDELPEAEPEGQQLGEAETSGEEAATDAGWQPARLAWAADLVAAADVEAQLEEQREGGEAADDDLVEDEEDTGRGEAAASSSGAAAAAGSSGQAAAEDVSLSSEGVSVGDIDSVCDFSESDQEEKVPEAYLIDICNNGSLSGTVSRTNRSSQETHRESEQARSGACRRAC